MRSILRGLRCFLALAGVVALAAGTPVKPDFNGDGKADLLWRSASSGALYQMLLNGPSIASGSVIYTEPSQAWQVVGTGDFDGDGKTDLLWWNSQTGQVFLMLMNGAAIKSQGMIYTEANTAWKIVGTGDFDGNGKADILWRNASTGQVYLMPMNGMSVLPGSVIDTEPKAEWQIVAIADFDGDGRADLLWWNSSTGQVNQMLMNGSVIKSQAMIYTEPNTAWKIVAAADFNGDGMADLLWRNSSTGAVYLMPMKGAAVQPGTVIHTEPNAAWQIVEVADFDGDGKADLLWWNNVTGQVYQMLMNGSVIKSQAIIYTEPNTAWVPAGGTPASSTSQTAISVSVAPGTAAILTGATQAFTATVTGSSNTAITWTASAGSITAAGVFTAPASAGTVTITATSQADPSKKATATVTVTAPAPVVSLSVSPSAVALLTGATQTFTAAVTGSSNTAVLWAASAGSITAAGVFTAPASAGTVTITATSQADTSKKATATVNVTAPSTSGGLTLGQVANGNGRYFSGYYPTWSDNWFSAFDYTGKQLSDDAIYQASNFAKIPGVYTHIMVAFAQPDFAWQGLTANTWTGTGLNFNASPADIKQAVRVLHQLNKKVIISVGGATYGNWAALAGEAGKTGPTKTALTQFLVDMGFDGLDVDYEIGDASPAAVTQFVHAIQAMREATDAAGGNRQLGIAAWSTGADYTAATPTDATYTASYKTPSYWSGSAGRERLAFPQMLATGPRAGQTVASLFDLVNVMSYDAQTLHYDPITAYDEYRDLVPASVPVSIGLEISPEGWAGGLLVVHNSESSTGVAGTFVAADQYGRTPRGAYSVERFGNYILGNAKKANPHDGLMLWTILKTSSVAAGSAQTANASTVASFVTTLFGYVPTSPTGAPAQGVAVAVSPQGASVTAGSTLRLSATVTGSANTAVTWTCTGGSISSTGLFTAGATPGSFTVTATSVADTSKTATVSLSVTSSTPVVAVTVTPTSATLQTGATQAFTAAVTGSSNPTVTWTCTGGTITAAGLFTAGSTPGTYTVTATSAANTAVSGSVVVTVTSAGTGYPAWSASSVAYAPGAIVSFNGSNYICSQAHVSNAGWTPTAAITLWQPYAGSAPGSGTVSVSVSPTSASLSSGATQQFSASVAGSGNTSVTWSCTGGTITAAGLFTAGATGGSFTVTATAGADTSKSATAAVAITAPAGVSTSVAVKFSRTSSWAGGYNADIILTNTGSSTLNTWTLSFTAMDTVTSSWNANQVISGQTVTFTPLSWNATLAPGASITVGIGASTTSSGGWAPPATATVNGQAIAVTSQIAGSGATAAAPTLGLTGYDQTGAPAMSMLLAQGATQIPLTASGQANATFTVDNNNPRALTATISGGNLVIQSRDGNGGRAGLRITETVSGAVRYVGARVKDAMGKAPGFPKYVSMGVVSEDSDADLGMFNSFGSGDKNRYVDNRYIYLNGGPVNGWWTWTNNPGDRARNYVRNSLKIGAIPTFVWYNIPDGGESYTTDLEHVQDAAYMKAYFQLLSDTLTIFNQEAPSETIMMVLEPDCLGYMMQLSGKTPDQIQAYASAAKAAGLWTAADPTYPDTLSGLVATINHIIKRDAPQVKFGWQFNVWASLDGTVNAPNAPKSLMKVTDADQQGWTAGRKTIYDNAQRIAAYYKTANITTEGAAFISFDKYGLDAVGSQSAAAADPAGSTWFWNEDHWNNYLYFVKTLQVATGLPVALWQLPVGRINSSQAVNPYSADHTFANLANTTNTYEDSTASYFFGDTFLPGTDARTSYFAANTSADAGLVHNGPSLVWAAHIQAAKDAGVFNLMFGDGVGISTKARPVTAGATAPDGWWLMTAIQRYLAAPVAIP